MIDARAPRPGLAVVALGAILAITAAWWSLALWPLDSSAPEWIARTREVCFGATATGLPHAGGWLLLIGEPIGMFMILRIVWGEELLAGLAALHRRASGRALSAVVVVVCLVGLGAASRRVVLASTLDPGEEFVIRAELPARESSQPPALTLIDQLGTRMALNAYLGRWVAVTFAFGHCEDICPIIVQTVQRARLDTGLEDAILLVVTLDPWRDTPERLASIARGWQLDSADRVLSGTVEEVNETLDQWRIARARDTDTGMVTHGNTIVVIDPAGRVAWRIEGAPARIRDAFEIAAAER